MRRRLAKELGLELAMRYLVTLFLICWSIASGWKQWSQHINLKKLGKSTICATIASVIICSATQAVEEDSIIKQMNFGQFLTAMNHQEVEKVLFKGINPTSCVATMRNGGEDFLVSEGFPSEDPKSPSGAAQVIALCQHTPGTICKQDLGGLAFKMKRSKPVETKMMLSHSKYPAASEFSREKVGYTKVPLDP